jgi:hypothetical protein
MISRALNYTSNKLSRINIQHVVAHPRSRNVYMDRRELQYHHVSQNMLSTALQIKLHIAESIQHDKENLLHNKSKTNKKYKNNQRFPLVTPDNDRWERATRCCPQEDNGASHPPSTRKRSRVFTQSPDTAKVPTTSPSRG